MLKQWLNRWRRAPIASSESLDAFLEQNAALIAQKTIIGYCSVKTNLPLAELIREQPFAEAFEISRSEGFAAVLADLIVVAEGYLRPAAADRAMDVADKLAAMYAAILARHPVPAHRATGWTLEIEEFRRRLALVQQAAPRTINQIAETSAERLFAALPIHERLREPDKPAVEASVRFMMVGLAHRFDAEIDSTAIVTDLLGANSSP